MTKYYWDREAKEWAERRPAPSEPVGPYVQGDLPVYQSPLSMKMIDGRRERREEMKKYDVREVDPSERPEGAGEPKGRDQLRREKQYLADRRNNSYSMDPQTRERLMRGQ